MSSESGAPGSGAGRARLLIVDGPEGSDLIEEWELYWEISQRLGTPIRLAGGELPLDRKPTKDEVLAIMLKGGRIPFSEVQQHRGGTVYARVEQRVEPADANCDKRFEMTPEGIVDELAEVRRESGVEAFSHRLISRRLRQVYNSSGSHLSESRKKGGTTNPAFMNPGDLDELGRIRRRGRDRILARHDLRRRGSCGRRAARRDLDGPRVGRSGL